MEIRHSVLVVTYRQESMIAGCLDSILLQKEMLYELIICDDCSPDETWSVILDYAAKYPSIIKPIRHQKNIGLFANLEFAINQASGDFINIIAGDDFMPNNILAKYSRYITENNLNCNDSFIIYTNSEVLKPDGRKVFKNNKECYKENMFEVCVQQCMWSWDTGMSRGLLDRIKKDGVCHNFGYQGDLIWHLNKIDNCDSSYFMDAVGYIYRSNVGVSIATNHEEHYIRKKAVIDEIYRRFPHRITPSVKRFYKFDVAWMRYNAFPNFKNYCSYIKEYFIHGRFPKGNIHRNVFKVLPPIWMKETIKKIIGRKY